MAVDGLMMYRTISQMLRMAVLPEIEKRMQAGTIVHLPFELSGFRFIQKRNSDGTITPIVELNQEVQPVIETIAKRTLSAGQPVTLQDITPDKCKIRPPEIDGKPQAYFM